VIPPPNPVIDAIVEEWVRNAAPLTDAEKDRLAVLLRTDGPPVAKRKPRPRRAA
jgi:hypothetical protein